MMLSAGAKVREANEKNESNQSSSIWMAKMRPMGAEFPVLIAFRIEKSITGSEGRAI